MWNRSEESEISSWAGERTDGTAHKKTIYFSKRKEFEIMFMLMYCTILGHKRSRIAIRTGSVWVTGAWVVGSISPGQCGKEAGRQEIIWNGSRETGDYLERRQDDRRSFGKEAGWAKKERVLNTAHTEREENKIILVINRMLKRILDEKEVVEIKRQGGKGRMW
jgi:hypothetical protein